MAVPSGLGEQLGMQLMQAAKIVEEQLDNEMKKIDSLEEDELEVIRSFYFG